MTRLQASTRVHPSVAKRAGPTRDPRIALAWLKSGKSVRIDSLNLRDHLRHVRALAALEGQGGAQ